MRERQHTRRRYRSTLSLKLFRAVMLVGYIDRTDTAAARIENTIDSGRLANRAAQYLSALLVPNDEQKACVSTP